jgi:putative hydrolase of the HAD superfamily
MTIKAVIWDLGGVLVRTEDQAPRAALADRLGLSRQNLLDLVFDSDMGLRAQRGEIDPDELWQWVGETVGIPHAELPNIQDRFWAGDRLDRELVALIRSLQGRYTTALLSNAWRDLRRVLKEQWQIDDAFDHIVISAEEGLLKPDPQIYHRVLDRVGVAPGQAVFIDDFAHNIAGAEAVGLQGIHFRHPIQAQSALERLLAENR